ncbi:MAG: DUF1015 family protein, partial [Dehalococcoidia bacterium]
MPDVRPLYGLRYQPAAVGDLGSVVAPPFDVISPEKQAQLHAASPYNVIRLEYGLDEPGLADRYQRAAATLRGWQRDGILQTETKASYYLYEQEFEHEGTTYRRRSIMGKVRLEPLETGAIRPHEHTMSGPKEDRLRLLKACRTQVSPILSLYRSDGGTAIDLCLQAVDGRSPYMATDATGQMHRLWVIDQTAIVEQLKWALSAYALYIADGHHRYETALAYQAERRSVATVWTGEEPENFVLMALTAADDPGLLILPIHRLVQPVSVPEDLRQALWSAFEVAEVESGAPHEGPALTELLERLHEENRDAAVLGALGVEAKHPLLLILRDRASVAQRMPGEHSDAWRRLDVNVLQYGILEPLLGIDLETVRAGSNVAFTESAAEAVEAVEAGRVPLAFLVNPTRPE